MSEPGRCAHADCRCPPHREHGAYCGGYCANAAEGESLPGEADLAGACACRHPACDAGKQPGSATERDTEVKTSTGRH